jgi:16S rRNA (adenine1518-N6/adenine1519-N6)-dimethyltransferase
MIIDRSGITVEDVVLEIGAGLGALTIPMARIAQKVWAVEIDHQIIDLLKTELLTHKISNVELVANSILKIDFNYIAQSLHRKIIVVGNLPYNISSQILVQLIRSRSTVSRAILMFQREMAQRITAQPNGKDYGRLSVMLQYTADIKKIADVPASQFFPKPRVDSEVLEICFKGVLKDPAADEAFLFKVIKAAFGQRRKTLKNALTGSELHLAPPKAARALEKAGIDPVRRAETLTVPEFVKLSNCLKAGS